MEYKQLKEDACRYVDELKTLIYDIADKLHARPELGQEEFFASALLKDILTDHGFTLDNPVSDAFPTAFHGTFGSGPFQMGFLAEYDALPKIGHGCGHNLSCHEHRCGSGFCQGCRREGDGPCLWLSC